MRLFQIYEIIHNSQLSINPPSGAFFGNLGRLGRLKKLGSLRKLEETYIYWVFEGLWLSVRIVQDDIGSSVSLLTKGHDFLRDLPLKILALFSFRGIGYQ